MSAAPPRASAEWLTLSQASELLGIHPMTLRSWVDAGLVRAFRTPGKHRRFRRAELVEFMEQQRTVPPNRTLISSPDQTLQLLRRELHANPVQHTTWYAQLSDEQRARHRQLGQRLLGLLLQYVSRQENAHHFLEEAKTLSRQYGTELAQAGLASGEIARAFLFFRRMVMNVTYHPDSTRAQGDADGVRLLQRINTFMDELLTATLDAYDAVMRPLTFAVAPQAQSRSRQARSGSARKRRR